MELESQSLPPTYSVQNNSNIQPMSLNPVLLEGPRYPMSYTNLKMFFKNSILKNQIKKC